MAGAAGVSLAGAGAFALTLDGGEAEAGPDAPLGTAVVTRGDLVDTEAVDGRLTYDDVRSVWTGAQGVVTWAPERGRTIGRGKTLLEVAGKPVTVMYGTSPMYRTLREGVSGADVRRLEENLDELGYDVTVDTDFTSLTAEAVRSWQDDRGLDVTGAVGPDQVVFVGGAVKVREVKAPEGQRAAAGQPVLVVSGTRRIVLVDLEAEKQDLARKGAKVTVELPDGKSVPGTISAVSDVAESTGTGQDAETTVEVEITLGGAGTGRLDEAPVTVRLESERRADVLSVPVEALLALREGGFGVEVVEGSARRTVPVTAGVFGGGRVEVSGTGLRAGMKVGVPAK